MLLMWELRTAGERGEILGSAIAPTPYVVCTEYGRDVKLASNFA